jgi:phosphoglycolate phosphatase
VKLVIFDLDQTLVDVFQTHDRAVALAFEEFFGKKDTSLEQLDYAGRSLLESFGELARLHAVPAADFEPRRFELLSRYEDNFVAGYPADPTPYILPGVTALLAALEARGDYLALYTGDSARVAQAMLTASKLDGYFRRFFYGTEFSTRLDMVRRVIETAEADTGGKFNGPDVVIVGDSVRDVACARAAGALGIAVATGLHTPAQLEAAGTDHLLADLADTQGVMNLIHGTV